MRLVPVAAGLLCAVALPAAADGTDLQIHGFAAQGLVISEGNNVNGDSTDKGGSSEFRELGVNFSYRPRGSLLFAAQMAAVEAGKAIDEDIVLEYGLVDYTALSGESGRLGLRAGKLKLPIGFYNDSRDAVFTRPGIILPESVYLENSGARAFGYFSSEGAGVYGDWYAGQHALYGELQYAGSQDLDDSAEIAILRRPASGKFEVDRGLIGRIADDYDGGRIRVALSYLTTELQYANADPNPATPGNLFPTNGGFDFDQAVLSLQYNVERWSATAEVVARHIELDDLNAFTPLVGPVEQDPAGWYLQGSYRMTPRWQWLLRHDQQIRDLDDRHGRQQAAGSGQPRHYFFARDWTAGTRYDVNANVALWAEFHYVDGAGWVNPLDNPTFSAGGAERYWNFFTVMAALRF
jgi:hypothetical protein